MGKIAPFSHSGPQSAKKGARNRLFNKPFGPGRQMTPKMRFWAQKLDIGRQNGILGPKSPINAMLDPEITFWDRFRSLAQKVSETKGVVAPFPHFLIVEIELELDLQVILAIDKY